MFQPNIFSFVSDLSTLKKQTTKEKFLKPLHNSEADPITKSSSGFGFSEGGDAIAENSKELSQPFLKNNKRKFLKWTGTQADDPIPAGIEAVGFLWLDRAGNSQLQYGILKLELSVA